MRRLLSFLFATPLVCSLQVDLDCFQLLITKSEQDWISEN